MTRVILFLMFFAALAVAVAGAVAVMRGLAGPPLARRPALTEDAMPKAVRRVAYVLLFVLLLGLTSGWLGAV